MIRHVSFDVWQTLISSNLAFSDARAAFIAEFYGLDNGPARETYKTVKSGYDKMAEETGLAYDSQGVYCGLLEAMGVPTTEWRRVMEVTERLFIEHPPVILDSTVATLRDLHDQGFTLSIGSNTNFVSGRVLGRVLEDRFGDIFAYKVFSDLDGYSKPHPKFFKIVARKAARLPSKTTPSEILHVGDNRICDGGAVQAGMGFHYVANPEQIPSVLDAVL